MTSEGVPYTGRDNLEVMADAVNYNKFLVDVVLEHLGGGRRVLDYGAGCGTYADMLMQRELTLDVVEPDGVLQQQLRGKGYRVVDPESAVTSGERTTSSTA